MGSSFCQSKAIQNAKDSRDCQQVYHIKHICWTRVREQCFSTSDSLTVSGPSINGSKFAVTWVGENSFGHYYTHSLFAQWRCEFHQISGDTIVSELNVTNHIIANTTPTHLVSLILFLSVFHPTQGEYIFLNHQPSPIKAHAETDAFQCWLCRHGSQLTPRLCVNEPFGQDLYDVLVTLK